MLIKHNFESRDVGKYCKLMMGERMGKEGVKKEKNLLKFANFSISKCHENLSKYLLQLA